MSRQGRAAKALLDLNAVVATCTDDAARSTQRDSAQQNTTTIRLHPEPLIVLASHAHLVRAVGNLLRNANEAIETVGNVSLTTERIVLAAPIEGYETIAPGDYAVVSVSDTGRGIAASDLGHIFEPFFTKKKTGNESGSGLGLAIVHGVVKEHHGFADVKSLAGSGTTFTLYFPRSTKAEERKAQSSDTPCGRAKILFIDDEPIQLRTAKRVLTHLGYDVDTQSSGRVAVDSFLACARDMTGPMKPYCDATRAYDLVIVDMQLNEALDGLEVIEEIQKLAAEARFVITSGHAPTSRAERALEKGIIWLSKPYTTDSLGRAVRDALQDARANTLA